MEIILLKNEKIILLNNEKRYKEFFSDFEPTTTDRLDHKLDDSSRKVMYKRYLQAKYNLSKSKQKQIDTYINIKIQELQNSQKYLEQ